MMIEKSFKSILEDSTRNKYLFYYSGTSVCCKEVSKDGLARDTIIASQVSDNFLTAIDLQDNIYVACINNEKGIYLFTNENNQWKLDQVLNIQGSGSVILLSLFAHNNSTHIIYAKQMTIANFYNIYHLYKPGGPHAYHINSNWKKNNIGEVYAEDIDSAYSAVITRDGIIHLVNEWYDGNHYLINYNWYDNGNDGWKKKPITNLFKKDIKVSILYEENTLNLLCYTYDDETSAIFYYVKKEGPGKDFEFSCLEKIKTEKAISPCFHIESGYIYVSWLQDNKFGQYSLNKEQKNWSKKFDHSVLGMDAPNVIEYIRNRKGKSLIIKKTYFHVDYKNNISLPYFKDNPTESSYSSDTKQIPSSEGDLIRYIPYLLDELKSLSEEVKSLNSQIELLEGKKTNTSHSNANNSFETKGSTIAVKTSIEQKTRQSDSPPLRKSSFRDQFMNTNKLISRPEATALYVGSTNIPNPEELTRKDEIKFVENIGARFDEKITEKQAFVQQPEADRHKNELKQDLQAEIKLVLQQELNPASEQEIKQEPTKEAVPEIEQKAKQESLLETKQEEKQESVKEPTSEAKLESPHELKQEPVLQPKLEPKPEHENPPQKDINLFKKIGDFFK